MSVTKFMTPQQRLAFNNAWHGDTEMQAPVLEIYPSGEQIGLSLNK